MANLRRAKYGNRKVTTPVDEMAFQLKVNKFDFEREFRFHAVRRWKADFRVMGALLLEVDGGGYGAKGGHTTGKGYEDDREKDAHALAMGFVMLRVTPKQVRSGEAIAWTKAIVERESFACDFWCPMCGAGRAHAAGVAAPETTEK
jgi:very-short-patch-repair endonuclease